MTTPAPAPFTADDYRARMDRAARAAADAGLAGVLVAPGPDLVWLTGYRVPADTERLTLLVLAPGQDPVLVVPKLEAPDAERATGAPALTLRDWTDGVDPYAVTAPLLAADGRFGVSDNAWALHLLGLQRQLPGSSYTALTDALPMLRAVKDAAELERLAAAGAAADAAYEEIRKVPFAGRKETDVAGDLADLLRRFGHEQVDFTVVGSGPNGASPHHEAGDRVIERGDMVVLDFGGLRHGYGSDTSRTVHVGEPSAEEQRVHDVVREAQDAACRAVRPGIACQEVDRVARAVITDAGYGEHFIHRTGHGIGVTTHEPPYMIEGEEQPLVPGMCFSVEPGIYLPGRFGVRIEDIVTVTETGGRRFNTTARELAIVD
ncbi:MULTISPECIES: aminopeptidase P family protein [Streptomyces]|uniref:Peptidase M24 n=2 Tax=Streptomyces TaxID=1883 RepID=A0A0W7X116_9ACTN|nr:MULTISPECIES: aminopeptidase P family protein [Streptomyces]KUF16528.1 peptidase M24 [Streptomyces silvensis]MVO86338.1 M24 family metallopeptidase [Streptomyces typhae]